MFFVSKATPNSSADGIRSHFYYLLFIIMSLTLADVFEDLGTVGEEVLVVLEELDHDSWMECVTHLKPPTCHVYRSCEQGEQKVRWLLLTWVRDPSGLRWVQLRWGGKRDEGEGCFHLDFDTTKLFSSSVKKKRKQEKMLECLYFFKDSLIFLLLASETAALV